MVSTFIVSTLSILEGSKQQDYYVQQIKDCLSIQNWASCHD